MKRIFLFLCMLLPFIRILHAQKIINLYKGAAAGSETWNWNEGITKDHLHQRAVYNVTVPTLTVFTPVKANGTAVVIAPGGGFHYLAIDHEGYDVARWLVQKGITAFVLKYRLIHVLTNDPDKEFNAKFENEQQLEKTVNYVLPLCIADGRAAVAWVRSHAKEYGIQTRRIGIIGFSAGGAVAAGTIYNYTAESRPDFVAPIYPFLASFITSPIPSDAPPLFLAVSSDDHYKFAFPCAELYKKWTDGGHSAELHIYAKGNHGFGMHSQNLPSDKWIEQLYSWMVSEGF